jgi:hypothetical protein
VCCKPLGDVSSWVHVVVALSGVVSAFSLSSVKYDRYFRAYSTKIIELSSSNVISMFFFLPLSIYKYAIVSSSRHEVVGNF